MFTLAFWLDSSLYIPCNAWTEENRRGCKCVCTGRGMLWRVQELKLDSFQERKLQSPILWLGVLVTERLNW